MRFNFLAKLSVLLIVALFSIPQLAFAGACNQPTMGCPAGSLPVIPCHPDIPTFTADLRGNPDSLWISPSAIRHADPTDACVTCCDFNTANPDNNRCIQFIVYLDPGAVGINFNIASGAAPPGVLDWQLMDITGQTCDGPYNAGDDVCLDGPGPHYIAFCKPGCNQNTYSIKSITVPGVGPTDVVSDACTGLIYGIGYDETTVTWNSVYPGAPGSQNGYLSCTSNCDSTIVTFVDGAPDTVLYEICGYPIGVDASCLPAPLCDTTGVEFIKTLQVEIQPQDPVICFGSTVGVTITAVDSGGKAPILYDWSPTNETTQSIQAMTTGWYSVIVYDNSGCPTATDSVLVTAFLSPIVADAGPDAITCINNPNHQLSGIIEVASGGIWTTCGDGTFSPDDTTLNATYIPGANDLANPNVPICIVLTSTGNADCPSEQDTMFLTIGPSPVVNAGSDDEVCANSPSVSLSGTSSTGSGTWSDNGAGGTFFPGTNSLNTTYTPPASATSSAPTSITLTLTSANNGVCLPVSDDMIVTIAPSPIVDAGPDETVCGNDACVTLSGSVTDPDGNAGTGTWTTSGNGSFTPNANDLNGTYCPSAADITAGTVTLTLTSTSNTSAGGAVCNQVTDIKVITITPAPTVDAGADRSVCKNNDLVSNLTATVTVATGVTWTASVAGVFSAPNSLITNFNPDDALVAPQTFQIFVETTGNGLCLPVRDTVNVTITSNPIIQVSNDLTICSNNPDFCIEVTNLVNATGVSWSTLTGGTITPNNTSMSICYTPSSFELDLNLGGVLVATATGVGNCLAARDTFRFNVLESPTVNAGPDQTLCSNNPNAQLNGSSTGPEGSLGAGTWIGGSGTFVGGRNILNPIYQPTAAEISGGSVTLTLQSTNNSINIGGGTTVVCNPVTDDITIFFTPSPTVNAGPDQVKCANNTRTEISGSVTVGTGGTWTTIGGDGTFDDANSLSTFYNPGTNDTANGSVCLVLTTTGVTIGSSPGQCAPVRDTMCIVFTPAPTANAGPDQNICSNNACNIPLSGSITVASGAIWTTTGMGTFSPNNTNLTPTYCAVPSDTLAGSITFTLTTTGNLNCNAVSDQMVMNFTRSPWVSAGPDVNTCVNNPVATLTGNFTGATGVQWSGGSNNFSASTSTTTTYTPSAGEIAAGFVDLYIQTTGNGNCLPDRDTVRVTFLPSPIVNAGSDQTVCANNNVVTLNGSVTNATGGTWTTSGSGSFGNANLLSTTYTPSATDITNGTVTLTLTSTGNGPCNAVTDQMVITITPAPTANAGADQTVCANSNLVTLNGSVTVATGGVWSGGAGTFSPNANTLNATYVPSGAEITAGTVTLTLTTTGNGNCNPVSDQMTITIIPSPVVNAGSDQTICVDNPSVNLAGTSTTGCGTWTGGMGTYSPSNQLSTLYIPSPQEITDGFVRLVLVSCSNGLCNPVTDTMNVTILPAPTVNAGTDLIVCGNAASVNISGTFTNAGGVQWTTSGMGTFPGGSTNLTTTYAPASADTAAGTVTLTLTTTGNGVCQAVSDQMTITFEDAPVINAGPDETVCSNEFPIQLQGSGSPATWSGGMGSFSNANLLNSTYTPDPSEIGGTVTLTLTTVVSGSCPAISDQVTFTLPPGPTANAGADITVCGDVNSVNISGTIGGTATGGQWFTSGTGTFVNNTNLSTTYNISAQDISNGGVNIILLTTGTGSCPPVTDTLRLTITPAPTVDAGFNSVICADAGSIQLNGTVTVATGATWTHNGGGSFVDANVIDPIYQLGGSDFDADTILLTFTVTTTGNGTCNPVSDQVTLTITPGPSVTAMPDFTICADSSRVDLTSTFSSLASTGVIWTTTGTGNFSPNGAQQNTTYFLSAQDTANGNNSLTFTVTTTGNGSCNPVFDVVVVTITPAPSINVGPDMTICADQPCVSLNANITVATGATWTSNGDGNFSNANIINPDYCMGTNDTAVGLVTLTATTTGNGLCRAVSDLLNVVITPAVFVSAGPDQALCADASNITLNGVVLVAAGGEWSRLDGTTTGIVNPTSLTTAFNPTSADTAAGCVSLRLTSTGNGLCQPVSDTLELCFLPIPVADAGPDNTVCSDTAYVDLVGSVQNAGGGVWSTTGSGNFFVNPNDLTGIYDLGISDSATTITIYLTTIGNGLCSAVTDSMLLTITPAPTVNVGPDLTVCADDLTLPLNATIQVATGVIWTTSGTGTFSNNTILNPDYNISNGDTLAGVVNLTATTTGNGLCNAVSDQLTLTITDKPTANAGLDQEICNTQTSVLLNGQVTIATGGQWFTTGNGTFVNSTNLSTAYNIGTTDTANGSVQLILETTGNGTCNPVRDTMNIIIRRSPTVNAGPDMTVCADTSYVELNGIIVGAGGGQWTTSGSGSFVPNEFTLASDYIISNPDKTSGSVILTLTSTGNGICAAISDQLTLTITPRPTIDAGPDQTVCATAPVVNLNGTVTISGGGVWTTSSGEGTFGDPNALSTTFTPSATQITAGTAVLTLTSTLNGQCLPVSDNLVVTILPAPVADAGNSIQVCANQTSIPLNGIIQNATGGIWTTSGGGIFSPNNTTLNASYLVAQADTAFGSVNLTLTSTGNGICAAATETIIVTFRDVPTIVATPDTICGDVNSPISLTASFANATGVQWTTVGGSGSFAPSTTFTSGSYQPVNADIAASPFLIIVTTTGNGSCPAAVDTAVVSIRVTPTVNAGPDRVVCANQAMPITINGSFSNASGVVWSSSGGGPFTNPTSAVTGYTISSTDISNEFAILTLTTTNNGFCPAVSDQMTLFITPTPTVDGGSRDTVCADHDTVPVNATFTIAGGVQWSSPTGGTFGDPNAANTYYILTAADIANGSVTLTVTTTGNGTCVPVTDTKIITITPAPTLNVLEDVSFCEDYNRVAFTAIFTIATGGIWTSNSDGTFTLGDGTTSSSTGNPILYNLGSNDLPGDSFTVYFTTTGNGRCYPYVDSATAFITPAPIVDAGNANVCASVDTVPLSGSFTGATGIVWYTTNGTGTFFPDSATLNAGYIPSVADRALLDPVIIIIETTGNGDCDARFDTISLSISDPITVDAGPDQTVCADTVGVEMDGSFANSGGAEWSTCGDGAFTDITDTNTVYVPGGGDIINGTVCLILTTTGNGFCDAVVDTMILTITPAPTIQINAASTCTDRDTLVLSSSITVATGIIWTTTGDGSFIPNNTDINADYEIGVQDKIDTVFTIIAQTTGNGQCNTYFDTLNVILTPSPESFAGNDTSLCADALSILLNGSFFVSGGGGVVWTTSGDGNFTDNLDPITTYTFGPNDKSDSTVTLTLTTTGGICSPVTDALTITFTPTPTVDAGGLSVCIDNPAIPLNGSVTVATGGLWSTIGGDGSFVDATSLSTTYNAGVNDIAADSVVFVLETTGGGSCNIYYDTMVVHLDPGPVATANIDTACSDIGTLVLSGTSTTALGTGQWTTLGDGTFVSDQLLNPASYTFGSNDVTNGFVDLILTTTNNEDCDAAFDTARIVITPAPIVNAGNNSSVCGDATTISLSGTVINALGGQWSTPNGNNASIVDPTSLITTYNINAADTARGFVTFVLTSTGNGLCQPVTDTVVVTITDVPTVNAGDELICADVTCIQLNGVVTVATGGSWTTTGDGTFVPHGNRLNPVYCRGNNDSINGSVDLILTTTGNGACQAYRDTIHLILTDPPTVNAGPDMAVCDDAVSLCLNASFTTDDAITWTITNGTGSFSTNANDPAACYLFGLGDVAGTEVKLHITTSGSSGCDPRTDSLVISIGNGPTVDAGPGDTICADAGSVLLSGSVTVATGGEWSTLTGGSFSPTVDTLTVEYFISSLDSTNGGVTLYLTTTGNGTCLPVTDSVFVLITPAPTLTAGADLTICADTVGVSITALQTVSGGLIWNTSGTGDINPNNTSTTITYVPSDDDIDDSIVVVTVQSTGDGLCQSVFDNITLFINPIPEVDAGFDISVCADAFSVTLNGSVSIAGGGTWTTLGDGTFVDDTVLTTDYIIGPNDTTQGFVDLILTTTDNGLCNAYSDTVRLTLTDAPTVFAGNDTTVCQNAPDLQLISTITVALGVQWTTSGSGTFSPSELSQIATYTFSQADTSLSSITIYATSTDNGTCQAVVDSFVITFDPLPMAEAGPDVTICADNPVVGLSGSVINAPGGTWTTSSISGTFDNATDLNTNYNVTSDDIANGLVNIFLETNPIGTCATDMDVMTITITPAPTIDAGFDQEWCADVTGIQLNATYNSAATGVEWTTSGNGNFLPNAFVDDPIYEPSTTDLNNGGTYTITATTTGTGLCNPVSDFMLYTITPSPTVEAGLNDTICADDMPIQLNGSFNNAVSSNILWTANVAGSFDDATLPNARFTVDPSILPVGNDPALLITFTIETQGSGTCNERSDQVTVLVNPIPTIDLGADDTVCVDIDEIFLSANVTNASSVTWTTSGTGTWPSGQNGLSVSYIPSLADRVAGATLRFDATTVGTDLCLDYTDVLFVTFAPAPTINVGPDQTICGDQTSVNIDAIITLANGGTWSVVSGNGSFASNFDPSTIYFIGAGDTTNGGPITLEFTTAPYRDCKQYSDQLNISFDPVPIVSAGDASVCADVAGFQLSGSFSFASGVIWSTNGDGTFNDPTSTTPFYTPGSQDILDTVVTLTLTTQSNNSCAPVSSDIVVRIIPLPVADGGPDKTVCVNSTTDLVGAIETGRPNMEYQWYDISGNAIGTMSNSVTVGIGTDTTQFVYMALDVATGCSRYDTVTISPFTPPVLRLDSAYCFAEGLILDADPNPPVTSGFFQWYYDRQPPLEPQSGLNQTFMIDEPGTWYVSYFLDECVVSDTTRIVPLPVLIGGIDTVCINTETEIQIEFDKGTTFIWVDVQTGDTLSQNTNPVTVTSNSDTINPQYFNVTVIDQWGCSDTVSVMLLKLPPPNLELENIPGCEGDEIILDATPTNIRGGFMDEAVYEWTYNGTLIDGAEDSTLQVFEAGTYTVQFGIGSCIAFDTSLVEFNPNPIPNPVPRYEFCFEQAVELVIDGGDATSWFWHESENTIRTEPVFDYGEYHLTVYNEFNCSADTVIEVVEVCEPLVLTPTGFIPNGQPCDPTCEDCNNCFYIKGAHYRNFEITIFNRWGEIVFHTTDPNNVWDGTYRGEPVESSVYAWILYFEGDTPNYFGPYQMSGKITVIR